MRIYLFSIENFTLSENLIRMGDICFLYDNNTLYVWIEKGESNKNQLRSQTKSAYICSNIQLSCPPNPMIFSYDGVSKRTGNHKTLGILTFILNNKILNDILINALNILEYKEDRIDIVPITRLIKEINKQQLPQTLATKENNIEVSNKSEIKEGEETIYSAKTQKEMELKPNKDKVVYPPQAYYYYDYLGKRARDYWMAHYLDDTSTQFIYRNIRKLNKEKYSQAFHKFQKEHPNLNIYSRKEGFEPIFTNRQPTNENDHIKMLFNLLSTNGYTQICDNKWKTPNDKLIIIKVEDVIENSIQNSAKEHNAHVSNKKTEISESTKLDVAKIINEEKLKDTFKRVSSTYKFFWFLAILSISKMNNTHHIYYKELVAKMITLAYPYTNDRISFGSTDKIHDIIQSLVLTNTFQTFDTINENEKRIISHYDVARIHTILNQLLLNVPYRFLSTWIPFTNNKEVIAKSQDPKNFTPYAIYPDYIELNDTWYDYFKENNESLFRFTKSKLVEYLLHFNDKVHLNKWK